MNRSILVVDDDPITRKLLQFSLQSEGFTVLEAENGLEALDKLDHHVPDLVLMDVMMPVMDGLTACSMLRQKGITATLPVIIFSAAARPQDIEKAHEVGATACLKKSVSLFDLHQAIENILVNHSSRV